MEDSNLRSSYDDNGFRDRRIQPALPTLQDFSVGQRFELWVDLRPQRFSRPPLSTTQPPHQDLKQKQLLKNSVKYIFGCIKGDIAEINEREFAKNKAQAKSKQHNIQDKDKGKPENVVCF